MCSSKKLFDQKYEQLTLSRRKVLDLFLKGQTYGEIKESLHIAESTIRKHIQEIVEHFGYKAKEGHRKDNRLILFELFQKFKPDLIGHKLQERYEQVSIEVSSKLQDEPIEQDYSNLTLSESSISLSKSHDLGMGLKLFGREKEATELDAFAREFKAVLLHARAGVGKTAFAEQYLENKYGKSVLKLQIGLGYEVFDPLEVLLGNLLVRLGIEPGLVFSASLNCLRQVLIQREYGVLIDNLESVLNRPNDSSSLEPTSNKVTTFAKSYRAQYLQLMQTLTDPELKSFTLITSRYRLCETGFRLKNYHLKDLSLSAWYQFFNEKKLPVESTSPTLQAMHATYGGNAMQMQFLYSNINDFNAAYDTNSSFNQECLLSEYWKSVNGDRLVRGEQRSEDSQLRNSIQEQFDHLGNVEPKAYKLLVRIGCYRYRSDETKIPIEGLHSLLWELGKSERSEVISFLMKDLGLIQSDYREGVYVYWLHPEIRAEAKFRLRADEKEKAHREAAQFWHNYITRVDNEKDAKRAFEACYHYIEIGAYEDAAKEILARRENSFEYANEIESGASLGGSLIKLSLFSQLTDFIYQLLDKIVDAHYLSKFYSYLGCIHRDSGKIIDSIDCFKESISFAEQKIQQLEEFKRETQPKEIYILRELIVDSLLNISNCKAKLGQFNEGINLCEQALKLLGQENHQYFNKRKIHTYALLAYLYSEIREDEKVILNFAKKTYEESYLENLDRHLEGLRLVLLGSAHKNIKSFGVAIDLYSSATNLEHCPTVVRAEAIYGLAEIYRTCEKYQDFEKSANSCATAINLLKGIGAELGLAEAYLQHALTQRELGQLEASEENFNSSLKLFEKINALRHVQRVRNFMSGIE